MKKATALLAAGHEVASEQFNLGGDYFAKSLWVLAHCRSKKSKE
jgi:hypothetical protein